MEVLQTVVISDGNKQQLLTAQTDAGSVRAEERAVRAGQAGSRGLRRPRQRPWESGSRVAGGTTSHTLCKRSLATPGNRAGADETAGRAAEPQPFASLLVHGQQPPGPAPAALPAPPSGG